MKALILVSGTPGTGKTTLSRLLAKSLKGVHIDLHEYFIKNKLYESYDKKRACYVVSPKVISSTISALKKLHQDVLIIDSHMAHESKNADLCIVTNCDIGQLRKRLKQRKYSASKIEENIEAEIFEVCKMEALEVGQKVLSVDTTKKIALPKLVAAVTSALRSKKKYHEFP